MMVEPASAPTPTSSWFCASGPMPEKSTIMPSGTAPSTGRTQEPTIPAMDGISSNNSEPSDIMLDAMKRTYAARGNFKRRGGGWGEKTELVN